MLREYGVVSRCLSLVPNNPGNPYTTIAGAIMIIFAFFNILSNSLLIFALYKSKQLRTFSNKFILIMTVSDLCLGMFAKPILGAFWISSRQRNCLELKSVEFTVIFLGYISFFMIITISLDRYLHVAKPIRYQTMMNTNRMTLLVVSCLISGLVAATITVIWESFYRQLTIVIFNFSLKTVFLILNTKTLKTLERHQENAVFRFQPGNRKDTSNFRTERLAAVKTICLVLGLFLICYIPYDVSSVFWTYRKFNRNSAPGVLLDTIYIWSSVIAASVSFLNSLIFIHGNTKCRRVVGSLLFKSSEAPW
ncbi:5-hydroxytryptamine receptor 4-like [Rhopilema esculentum]|uniref:5-hydroxytryptamine receptor 4-like n=1 Tax=Rhopilema esculentum TaxID=499914 RepID=UPI0031DE7567